MRPIPHSSLNDDSGDPSETAALWVVRLDRGLTLEEQNHFDRIEEEDPHLLVEILEFLAFSKALGVIAADAHASGRALGRGSGENPFSSCLYHSPRTPKAGAYPLVSMETTPFRGNVQ